MHTLHFHWRKEDTVVALVFMTFTAERDKHGEALRSCRTPLQQVQASPADFLFKFRLLYLPQWCPVSRGCVCWPLALNSCATGVEVFGNSTFCFEAGVWRLDEVPGTPAGSAPCLCDWEGIAYSCLKACCPAESSPLLYSSGFCDLNWEVTSVLFWGAASPLSINCSFATASSTRML